MHIPGLKVVMPATPYDAKELLKSAVRDSNLTNSYMVLVALETASTLKKEYSLDTEVIDLRSISPIDRETIINTVKKTNRVVILNEACEQGGIAGEIIAFIQDDAFDYLVLS